MADFYQKQNGVGQYDWPTFHDAKMTGISYLNDRAISLSFNKDGGGDDVVMLKHVVRFKCDNLREGNIVLDFSVETGSLVSVTRLGALFTVEERSNKNLDATLKMLERGILDGELIFIEISPSYGGHVFAVCKELAVASRTSVSALSD